MRVHFEAYLHLAGLSHKSRSSAGAERPRAQLPALRAEVTPVGGDGRPLELRSPSGGTVPATTVVRA